MQVSPFPSDMVSSYGLWDDLFAIDFANSSEGIAIELDGPTHFLKGGGRDGRTKAKRRILEKLGWKVISLEEKESRMMEKEGMEFEAEWWRGKLKEVGWEGNV